jgi:hypothetical protein
MVTDNVGDIKGRIARACEKVGRSPAEVALVAVSKTFPAGNIKEVVACGVRDIGENYVQELLAKRELLGDLDIRWHFIGHLQSNKAKYLAEWIHLIHAVDNVGVARELEKKAAAVGRTVEVLIEVNVSGEATKFGVAPGRAEGLIKNLASFRHIRVGGLMTMSPFLPDPESSRPWYRQTRMLRDNLARIKQENVEMKHLSMGMTGDFEVAIEEGATIVRLGTAIFGPRERNES